MDGERETEVLWQRYEGQAEFDNSGGDGVQKNMKRTKERERRAQKNGSVCVCEMHPDRCVTFVLMCVRPSLLMVM